MSFIYNIAILSISIGKAKWEKHWQYCEQQKQPKWYDERGKREKKSMFRETFAEHMREKRRAKQRNIHILHTHTSTYTQKYGIFPFIFILIRWAENRKLNNTRMN